MQADVILKEPLMGAPPQGGGPLVRPWVETVSKLAKEIPGSLFTDTSDNHNSIQFLSD